jgi:thymidylate synthase
MMTELKWFLRGDTNIKYLVDNGCNIWNGDAYKAYQNAIAEVGLFDTMMDQEEFIQRIKTDDEFAKKWGELGPIYGAQWRNWKTESIIKTTLKDPLSGEDTYVNGTKYIDQIKNLINDLKTNPDSRRLMVNAWNVGELDQMVLPPCHYGFQVYTQERDGKRYISLMWNQRSVDTFLGLPFNIASYGLLLMIIAKEVNMIPDELIGNLGDVHLYKNHIEQAVEQIRNLPFKLPTVIINDEFWNPDMGTFEQIKYIEVDDFWLEGYQSHEKIKAPLSN